MALDTNLVAYYKLDESSGNAADATGNGYTLTNTNSVTYVAGKINNAATGGSTQGHNKRLSRGDAMGVTLAGAFSISLWYKPNNVTSLSHHVVNWRGSSDLVIVKYLTNQWTVSQGVGDPITYSQTLTAGTWYHVVITFPASGTAKLYINNVNVASGTRLAASGGGGEVDLFQASDQTTNGGAVQYDEVGFWSRELTAADINALYASGNALDYPFTLTMTFAQGAFTLTLYTLNIFNLIRTMMVNTMYFTLRIFGMNLDNITRQSKNSASITNESKHV